MCPSAPLLPERGKFLQPRQMDLVLDDAVPEPARRRLLQQCVSLRRRRRHRLLAIDVLAGGDRLLEHRDALLRGAGIEEHAVGGVRQRDGEIAAPIRDVVGARDGGQALRVAAKQQQSRQQPAGAGGEAALLDDRDQCIRQMLGRADAAGGAVDDDADRLGRHHAIRLRRIDRA